MSTPLGSDRRGTGLGIDKATPLRQRSGRRPGFHFAGLRSSLYCMDYSGIITIEPGKRGGKPCIRGLRMTVADVLGYLASGMSEDDILRDFPYLTS
jgi:uncharacterized protein (DUF433 family)